MYQTGPLVKWLLLAHNRLKSTRTLLKMRSTIEIQKTPRSGPGQLLTMTGYSSVLQKINCMPYM